MATSRKDGNINNSANTTTMEVAMHQLLRAEQQARERNALDWRVVSADAQRNERDERNRLGIHLCLREAAKGQRALHTEEALARTTVLLWQLQCAERRWIEVARWTELRTTSLGMSIRYAGNYTSCNQWLRQSAQSVAVARLRSVKDHADKLAKESLRVPMRVLGLRYMRQLLRKNQQEEDAQSSSSSLMAGSLHRDDGGGVSFGATTTRANSPPPPPPPAQLPSPPPAQGDAESVSSSSPPPPKEQPHYATGGKRKSSLAARSRAPPLPRAEVGRRALALLHTAREEERAAAAAAAAAAKQPERQKAKPVARSLLTEVREKNGTGKPRPSTVRQFACQLVHRLQSDMMPANGATEQKDARQDEDGGLSLVEAVSRSQSPARTTRGGGEEEEEEEARAPSPLQVMLSCL